MLRTWVSTVRSEINSRTPTFLLVSPWATSRAASGRPAAGAAPVPQRAVQRGDRDGALRLGRVQRVPVRDHPVPTGSAWPLGADGRAVPAAGRGADRGALPAHRPTGRWTRSQAAAGGLRGRAGTGRWRVPLARTAGKPAPRWASRSPERSWDRLWPAAGRRSPPRSTACGGWCSGSASWSWDCSVPGVGPRTPPGGPRPCSTRSTGVRTRASPAGALELLAAIAEDRTWERMVDVDGRSFKGAELSVLPSQAAQPHQGLSASLTSIRIPAHVRRLPLRGVRQQPCQAGERGSGVAPPQSSEYRHRGSRHPVAGLNLPRPRDAGTSARGRECPTPVHPCDQRGQRAGRPAQLRGSGKARYPNQHSRRPQGDP